MMAAQSIENFSCCISWALELSLYLLPFQYDNLAVWIVYICMYIFSIHTEYNGLENQPFVKQYDSTSILPFNDWPDLFLTMIIAWLVTVPVKWEWGEGTCDKVGLIWGHTNSIGIEKNTWWVHLKWVFLQLNWWKKNLENSSSCLSFVNEHDDY